MIERDTRRRHRVAIIGAGFGGLFAAKKLRDSDVDITIIDRTNHHLFQPLLYQVATGILSEGDIAPPIRDVLRHQLNARVLLGEVRDIDVEARRLVLHALDREIEVAYDSLIVAAGAGQSYFGRPEFAAHAPGMKTIDHALELRGRIFGAFEMAEHECDAVARRRWLTFVVIGGGPTGVELAGQLAELSRGALQRNFRRIDPAEARVIVLDGGPSILSTFPQPLRERALRDLSGLGVEIHTGTVVTQVDERGVETNSDDPALRRIEAATKIWAAGVEASPLGRLVAVKTGAEVDRAGRVKVEPDLTVAGHPEIFVIGDLMSLDGLPGVAQVAIQSGRHAAATIARRLSGDASSRPFRYCDVGTLATISRFRAVAALRGVHAGGLGAWVLWLAVHVVWLTGFKNRLGVLFHWLVAFLGRGRPQRVITEQQVFARQALETGTTRVPALSREATHEQTKGITNLQQRTRKLPGSAALLALMTVLLAACRAEEVAPLPLPAVRTAAVERLESARDLRMSGTIEAERSTALSFAVPGTVQSVFVEEGQPVKRGEVLARLNPITFEHALGIAHADASRAQDMVRRLEPMHRNNTVPEVKWIEAQTALEGAQHAVAIARKNLGDAVLRAPEDGVIARRAIEPGATAAPGMPALVLVQTQSVNAVAPVPENEVARIRVGQPARITVAALGKEFQGKVSEIGVLADPLTRTYPAKIALDNANGELKIGMVVDAHMAIAGAEPALGVPREAVRIDERGKSCVFVVANGQARRREVETIGFAGERIAVARGVREGEEVVVSGTPMLADGVAVRLEKAEGGQ
ncbi:MAG TPA: efflux RND transporter periplasmic adaptor subunit [Thermoanaerobaculia bacterium]|nr:efflux RND transporter periplasmic adaptor subunit [Thermoanaerobaculia bacterium]